MNAPLFVKNFENDSANLTTALPAPVKYRAAQTIRREVKNPANSSAYSDLCTAIDIPAATIQNSAPTDKVSILA
jgi:hypothetical protein